MSQRSPQGLILGAGMTGLAAGLASGLPVYEAAEAPGGICRSYAARGPAGAYRFEVGGGHWIFGGDRRVTALLESFSPLRAYRRRSAVRLGAGDAARRVPFPLQYHLHALPAPERQAILAELRAAHAAAPEGARAGHAPASLDAWLRARFGPTLHRRFFGPFHARYTAGLATRVRPEDRDKSPFDLARVERGARDATPLPDGGYNARFVYPACGLDELARRMATRCDLRAGQRVVAIDTDRRVVHFAGGARAPFQRLVSTLPLHHTLALCDLDAGEPDPCTGVRVLNLAARRGPRCPDDHWVYVAESRAGFHRVGFYSNVDAHFLPEARRGAGWVSLYVERATRPGAAPDPQREAREDRHAIEELQDWGWIGEVEVADARRIEVAYTWVRPHSDWRERAVARLEACGIAPVGRYGAWRFQGIARSIRDGLDAGLALREALEHGGERRAAAESRV